MKIGAQRLYKAVKAGDTGIVLLFLTSQNQGGLSYQRVFDSWVGAGMDVDMLNVLMQYKPFQNYNHLYHRRNKTKFNNDQFHFGENVLQQIIKQPQPKKEYIIILSKYGADEKLNHCQLARNLSQALNEGKEWPWSIAACSRGLGFEVATHQYNKKERQIEAIDWFNDMFGPITEQDLITYNGDLQRYINNYAAPNYEELYRLINNDVLFQHIWKNNEQYKQYLRTITQGYKRYNELSKFAQWMGEEG